MKHLKPLISAVLTLSLFFSLFSCAYPALAAQLTGQPEAAALETEPGQRKPVRTVGELNTLRTENSKTFQLSNGGKKAAVYPQNVHFCDASGAFVDYDNTLCETEDAYGAAFMPAASDLDIRLAEISGGERLVTVNKDDYTLSWTYDGAKEQTGKPDLPEADNDPETLDTFASSLTFTDVFNKTDIQYILYGDELKENVVLNDKTAPHEFNVRFICPGLTVSCSEDGRSLYFTDVSGAIIFEINAPYAFDANGEAFYNITYTLTETTENDASARFSIDEAWLTAKERAFPVVIDPVLLTKQEYTAAGNASAYVASATPTACYGYGGNSYEGSLYAGYASSRGRMRSFIKFSLPSLNTADRVVRARMYTYLWDASPDVTVKLMKVTQSWNVSTVNWNNQPDCDYNTVYEYKLLKDTDFNTYDSRFIDWDITKLVDGWYRGDNNYGVMLASDAEYGTSYERAWFFSTHYPTVIQARPLLAVEFRNMSGYEDYYSYLGVDAGRGGSADVNLYNGNLVVSQPVTAAYGGVRMPVSITAVYNSNKEGADTGRLGRGWQLNYQLCIRPNPYITSDSTEEEQKYKYYMNDADGTEHYFYFENLADISGKDEDGLGYTLVVDTDVSETSRTGVRYTVTNKNSGKWKFNGYGNLIAICDTNGNSISLEYDGVTNNNTHFERLLSITDGAGKSYTLTYASQNAVDIVSVTDPAHRVTSFTRDASGCLTGMQYPDTAQVSLSYDNSTEKSLLSVTDLYGVTASATYAAGTIKRVASLTVAKSSAVAEQYTFDYLQNTTDVTDLQGHIYTYQFNSSGQTTGAVYNDALEAQAYAYEPGNEPGDKKANKLKTASRTQTPVDNYVKNSSFHTGVTDYSVYKSVTSDTSTVVYASSYGHYANGSLRVTQPTGSAGYILALQAVYVPAGTYTVSCFTSTNGTPLSAAAPMLSVEVRNSSAHLYSRTAEPITGTGTGEWVRQSVTVTLTSGQYLRVQLGLLQGRYGTAWFDDVQVEAEAGVSSFNILENPQFFNGSSAWTFSDGSVTVNTASPLTSGGKYASVPGDELTQRTVSQNVKFNGSAGQVFSFGAWARAHSVPLDNDKGAGVSKEAGFKLRITLLGDGDDQTRTVNYNPYVSDWQFASGSIAANNAFTQVRIEFVYDNNQNTAAVTGLYCLAEEYGETYTYDDNGNLISSADVAKVENAYGYAENNLTSVQSDSRDRSFASYEEDTNNLAYTVNTEGQFAEYAYDAQGNLTYAEVTPARFTTTPQTNKYYRIINAETGMALGASSTQATADAVNARFSNANETLWMLMAGSGSGEYRLKRKGVNGYLAVDGSGSGTLQLKSKTGVASTTQAQFRLDLQSDGSFKILTKTSSFSCAVDAHWNSSETADTGYPVYQYSSTNAHASQKWYIFEVSSDTSKMSAGTTYDTSKSLPSVVIDANGSITNYTYNSYRQINTVNDPNGNTTTYSYDAMSRVTYVTSGVLSAGYVYSDDLLGSVSTSNNVTYSFTHDTLGRLTKTQANGVTLAQTAYDAYGRVSSRTDAGWRDTDYSYNALDRLSDVSYNGNTLRYYYGSNGKFAQTTDSAANTRTKYVYDLAGRVVSERTYTGTALDVSNLQSALDYTYTNGTNQISAIKTKSTLGTNTLCVTYGDLSQAQSAQLVYVEQWNGADARAYGYDPFGRLQQTVTYTGGTNLTGTYTYASDPYDSSVTTMRVSQLQTAAATYSYTYDDAGNILSENDGTYTTSYVYDANYRLTRENNQRAGYTYVYTYSGGNITSRKTYAYTTGTPGTVLSTDMYTYGSSVYPDLLTKYNNKNITYTGAEPVIYGGYTLDWYKTGLISEYTNGLDTHSYTYDVSGRRLEKEDNGVTTEFIYAGDLLLGQKTGSNSLTFKFDSNGDYFGFTYNGTPYYYVKNLQGDVVAIANNAGTIVARYYYDAWGKLLSYTDTSGINIATINPIRYRSYYYDTETGFYFLQSRYYDPEIGRFISPDDEISATEPADMNVFAYCKNNPVMFYDPYGHRPIYDDIAEKEHESESPLAAIAALCFLLVCYQKEVAAFAETVIKEFEKFEPLRDYNDQSVYYLKPPGENKVVYVGRTNDPERRAGEHRRSKDKKDLEMVVVKTGLSKEKARLLEHTIIYSYGLDRLLNARNEIGINKVGSFIDGYGNTISLYFGLAVDELRNLLGG